MADSEDSLFWEDLFDDLKERGLRSVKLIVSDGHKGIQKTVRESFIGSSWPDVLCTSDKTSSKEGAKKEAERSG
ncbi:Mobile element protein [Methanosarcina lacustris Z-7289]|uniref:Mobile element protein n=1 Tax=Methanosarcina lacustris Z-7289 TaxID=1434111 RepID=A0A0E3S9R8_9EURY|nr:Mobile element protein [Methanosarcina lacustris Z-7289]